MQIKRQSLHHSPVTIITNECENDCAREILDTVHFLNLCQHHFMYNNNGRLLDYHISKHPKISKDPLLPSDNRLPLHAPLSVSINQIKYSMKSLY